MLYSRSTCSAKHMRPIIFQISPRRHISSVDTVFPGMRPSPRSMLVVTSHDILRSFVHINFLSMSVAHRTGLTMSTTTLSPEFVAENSKGNSLAEMTAVMVLATFFVVLRLVVRMYRKVGFWLDEYLMLASLVLTWGLYVVCILEYRFGGFGRHIIVLDETDLQAVLNMEIVGASYRTPQLEWRLTNAHY